MRGPAVVCQAVQHYVAYSVQEKVQEIIATGHLSRNEAWAEDPTRKVKKTPMSASICCDWQEVM